MNNQRVAAAALIAFAIACSSGGGDSGTEPTNEPPIVSFTFAPYAVPQSVPVDLTISASDPDGDPLTITWTITRGSLTAQNSKKTIMRWSVPAALGVDTVTVRVTDGTQTRKLIEVVKVGTALSGSSTAPALFQKSKSPYIITLLSSDPRLTVLESTTTTIEPGTEIYLNTAGSFLDVLGNLVGQGTAADPIIIRRNDRTLICGSTNSAGWDGIRVEQAAGADSSGTVDFANVEIWNADNGIRLRDSAFVLLQDCRVRCSGKSGVLLEGSGRLLAFDSEFTDGAGDGIAIASLASDPDSVHVKGCKLAFNHGSGIRMDIDDLTQSVPIVIEYNDIEFNESHGISLAHAVFPRIHFNNFRGNGSETISNLFLQSGYPNPACCPDINFPNLNAACNFWGSAAANQSTIDIGIHDQLDQSTVHTRVTSSPWLNASADPMAPPGCTP